MSVISLSPGSEGRRPADARGAAHPNEFDRRRIAAALSRRHRYLYVEPQVVTEPDGYRIESACCSRTIDPDGGVVDIARITWSRPAQCWTLSWKDRRGDIWRVDLVASRLDLLLERLLTDSDRRFWQ